MAEPLHHEPMHHEPLHDEPMHDEAAPDQAAPDEAAHHEAAHHEAMVREEIRFAVVLNGGVSLAVWMGGAVLELDRLTRARGPYRALLDLVAGSARADVIAGTSAGGINGACLALSQVNAAADLTTLRDLWAEQGRMESLLREPFQGSPASLLRGDDYFLPRLSEAMDRLTRPHVPFRAEDRPMDLTISATLLRGARTVTVDAMGARLPQMVHEGRFEFRREPTGVPTQDGSCRDDFAPSVIAATAARLGLAARTTAGFPIAFEPSFVPVTRPRPGSWPLKPGEDPARPDMGGVASWRTTGPTGELPEDRSRFAVDGGLLANTPTRAALQAVDRLPAAAPVRRIALLVYPHAPVDAPDPADRRAEPPTVTAVAGGLLGALSSQGSRTFVEEVEAHNRLAGGHRGSREDVLRTVGRAGELHELAGVLLAHYRALRMRRAALAFTDASRAQPGWSYERMRALAESAQDTWVRRRSELGRSPRLPYVPDAVPSEAAGESAGEAAGESAGYGAVAGLEDGWAWGTTTADGVLNAALDLLKRLVWVLPEDAALPVEQAKATVHDARAQVRLQRGLTDDRWREEPALCALAPDEAYWTLRLAAYQWFLLEVPEGREELQAARDGVLAGVRRRAADAGLPASEADRRVDAVRAALEGITTTPEGSIGRRVRAEVERAVEAVATVLPALQGLDTSQPWLGELDPWRRLLPAGSTAAQVLARLLSLEVVTWSLTEEVTTGAEFPVDLVQLSLQAPAPFAVRTLSADDKVGGLALHRFGAFLKQSWRVNDWVWGRLDAASTLCRALLDPERLRRVSQLDPALSRLSPEQAARALVDRFVAEAFGPEGPPDPRIAALAEDAVGEVTRVCRGAGIPGELPATLPALADLATWALHLRIAAEELPALARAVRADRVDGAHPSSRGELMLQQEDTLLRDLEALPAPPQAPPPSRADSRDGGLDSRDGGLDSRGGGLAVADLPPDPEDPHLALRLRLGVRALDAFDRAGIGREELSEEGTSDQMIRTVTSAVGVGVTVADGERSGLAAVKPVTRALRGAALLPYWAVTGLTRGGSLARFAALLAFAFGGTLLALALLGVVPRGLAGAAAAVGAGALLGAFGYAALRTGSLLHGLVLLSPLVPLLAVALAGVRGAAASEAATAGATTVVVVLLLVLGLLVLGSLPAPLGTPVAAVLRGLDGVADRAGYPPGLRNRRGRAAARVALRCGTVLVVLAAASVAAWWLWERTPALAEWVRGNPGWAAAVGLAAVAVGTATAWFGGRSLRPWRLRGSGNDARWTDAAVTHPAGATACWSVVYGVLYLVAAAALAAFAPPGESWAPVALVACVVAAGVLLLLVPVAAPLAARTAVRCTLVADAGPVTYRDWWAAERPDASLVDSGLSARLLTRDLAFSYLVRPGQGETLVFRPGARRTRREVARRLAELRAAAQEPGTPAARRRLPLPRRAPDGVPRARAKQRSRR